MPATTRGLVVGYCHPNLSGDGPRLLHEVGIRRVDYAEDFQDAESPCGRLVQVATNEV